MPACRNSTGIFEDAGLEPCAAIRILPVLTQLNEFRRSWTAATAVQLPLNCVSSIYEQYTGRRFDVRSSLRPVRVVGGAIRQSIAGMLGPIVSVVNSTANEWLADESI